jgi:DNA-directed RNA polymerase specialized sigma24 family protein
MRGRDGEDPRAKTAGRSRGLPLVYTAETIPDVGPLSGGLGAPLLPGPETCPGWRQPIQRAFPEREELFTASPSGVRNQDLHDEAYERAAAAARIGDAAVACTELMKSRMIDGLAHRLMSQQWWSFPMREATEVIADAVDELFQTMRERPRLIDNVGGLLWTIVYRRAGDRLRAAKRRERYERALDDGRDLAIKDELREYRPEERRAAFDDEVEREARVRSAIGIARTLLPQLKMPTSERVLAYFFDALERGADHVDYAEMAAAFASTAEAVRKASERGFDRLERVAREAGITDTLDIPGRAARRDLEEDDDTEEGE